MIPDPSELTRPMTLKSFESVLELLGIMKMATAATTTMTATRAITTIFLSNLSPKEKIEIDYIITTVHFLPN
jgi:hypothetical protein